MTDTTTTTALRLDGVAKQFGGFSVLNDVNLTVREGEKHGLLGPNGAGKSTLFNVIAGEYRPTSGVVRLRERTISGMSPARINRLGLSRSFQITNIFAGMTVLENILIGVMARHGMRVNLWGRGQRMREIEREAHALLARIRLVSRADTLATDLAYSEQRALELGMTLATGADIILLDEPTAGMSREETAYTVALIKEVTEDKTLLLVEHDMSVVFGLCDRISVLVYGKVLVTGSPDEIRAHEEVQRAYLGNLDSGQPGRGSE